MTLTKEFHQQTVVITGGASGIGQACAGLFAGLGALVLVADRDTAAAAATAQRIGGVALQIDVGDQNSVSAAANCVRDNYGMADILVNCAGVLQRTLPPGELSQREWDFVSHIDLRGTYLCCVAFGAPMAQRHTGGEKAVLPRCLLG